MSKNNVDCLKVGFIGSGFIANFHLESLVAVRNVEVVGIYSPTRAKREAFAQKVKAKELGDCVAYDSIEDMLGGDKVDAVWVLCPNHTRLDVIREIHRVKTTAGSNVFAIACEKPLARNLAEAKEVLRLTKEAGLNHGYLENQVYCNAVQRGKEIIWKRAVPVSGRPYLARASEEHCGPHDKWFWDGRNQGGGVMSDMMCHSVEVGRFLLSEPGLPRGALKPVRVTANIANLRWSKPHYAKQLKRKFDVSDYALANPVEDFARAMVVFEDENGDELLVEGSVSWAYIGAGLKIDLELNGPEYAMEFSSLDTNLKVFMSRDISGEEGEDLIEKQNSEQGLMPVMEDEPGTYGYINENRHMVDCFRKGEIPSETFEDGVAVVELLMALYKSAEEGRTIFMAEEDLANYIPAVAKE